MLLPPRQATIQCLSNRDQQPRNCKPMSWAIAALSILTCGRKKGLWTAKVSAPAENPASLSDDPGTASFAFRTIVQIFLAWLAPLA
jgi:hypothetical protein